MEQCRRKLFSNLHRYVDFRTAALMLAFTRSLCLNVEGVLEHGNIVQPGSSIQLLTVQSWFTRAGAPGAGRQRSLQGSWESFLRCPRLPADPLLGGLSSPCSDRSRDRKTLLLSALQRYAALETRGLQSRCPQRRRVYARCAWFHCTSNLENAFRSASTRGLSAMVAAWPIDDGNMNFEPRAKHDALDERYDAECER